MAKTTISCEAATRDRLNDIRGDKFKNWDAFLHTLADHWEQHAEAAGDHLANGEEPDPKTDCGDEPDTSDSIDRVIDRIDDLEAQLPRKIAEELRR